MISEKTIYNKLASAIHENAKSKGFWDNTRNEGELLMLVVSEISEALEAHRKGKFADLQGLADALKKYESFPVDMGIYEREFKLYVKDSFEDEIADTIIRILDYAANKGISIDPQFYEQQGDFQVFNPNVGELFLDVTGFIYKAFVAQKELSFLCGEYEGSELEMQLNGAIILLLNLCNEMDIDFMRHIELKMRYNKTRERMHGKAY